MEAMILDRDFNSVMMLDNYQSFIWTDKYQSYGDFEIYSNPTPDLIQNAQKDYYVWYRDSEHMMIIDTIEIKTDLDQGNMLIISGESLESILKRRWLIDKKIAVVDGKDLQDFISSCFNHCFGSGDRKIEKLIFERNPDLEASALPAGKAYKVSGDYYEANFYDVVEEVCIAKDLGFKITLEKRSINGSMQECFVFKLYNGVDRSYDQEKLPFVTFSSNFGNLLTSDYYSTYKTYKNVAIVHYTESVSASNGNTSEVAYEKLVWLGDGTAPKGLDRREEFLTASPDQDEDNKNSGSTAHKNKIGAQMIEEGRGKLKELATTEAFDGEVDFYGQYQYGRDFLVGDIVQIVNQYNYSAKSRVTAVTFSSDTSGEKTYPTFEKVEDQWSGQNGS